MKLLRRRTLQPYTLCLAALLLIGAEGLIGRSAAQGRNCGPPPRAKPQRRTGGESFPPLPLPATPLRRSEKKRQPSPPKLVGKVVLGEIKWVTNGSRRYSYRDWMTDPADMKNLLRWTNRQLGIRYTSEQVDLR
ncbi:MAG: hypothetical protein GWP05_01885, partial [Anaerolineaceae bacterium]|nr:hypothetical protein [Anaerolineaceae bacterium]